MPHRRGLLGFAATSFVITITLSAADAAAHITENPLAPDWMHHPVVVTTVLLLALGGIFLKGFRDAITLAVVLVAVYLGLNIVVIIAGLQAIVRHPEVLDVWRASLLQQHGHPLMVGAMALLVFPKLALGLSGFETGVAVMPLVRGDEADTDDAPIGRIRNATASSGPAPALVRVASRRRARTKARSIPTSRRSRPFAGSPVAAVY